MLIRRIREHRHHASLGIARCRRTFECHGRRIRGHDLELHHEPNVYMENMIVSLTKWHWWFLSLLLVIAIPLLWRLFWLHPLYFRTDVRTITQSAISKAADREGWLLSDISLKAIDKDDDGWRAVIMYRNHFRGEGPLLCQIIRLSDASLQSCDD